jgi:hypothetical protein
MKQTLHDFYSKNKKKERKKERNWGKEYAKPMHHKKRKPMLGFPNKGRAPSTGGHDSGMHNFFLSQTKPKGYLKQ